MPTQKKEVKPKSSKHLDQTPMSICARKKIAQGSSARLTPAMDQTTPAGVNLSQSQPP
jgi:hypothetical protein